MASSSRLKPNEQGEIQVSVDIRGKTGPITKTIQVHSNDTNVPVTTLTVRMTIKDPVHMKEFGAREIFNEGCRDCHVEQGAGKRGFDLFRADCFMCHNAGKSAPTISLMAKRPKEYLRRIIWSGIEHSMMPGWHMKHGGPLDDAEVESLIDAILPKTPGTVF